MDHQEDGHHWWFAHSIRVGDCKKKKKKRCTKKYTMWNYFYKCIILITYYVFDLTSSRLLTKNNRSKPKTKSQDLKCGWNSTIAAGVNEIKNDIKSAADSVSSVKRRSSLFVQDNSIRAIEAENFFSLRQGLSDRQEWLSQCESYEILLSRLFDKILKYVCP